MTTFRIQIPSRRKLRPEEKRAIGGCLLDAARVWLEGHTLRSSLHAPGIQITTEEAPAPEANAPRSEPLSLPGWVEGSSTTGP